MEHGGRPFHGLFSCGWWEWCDTLVPTLPMVDPWPSCLVEQDILHPKSSACRDLPAAAQWPEGWKTSQLNLPVSENEPEVVDEMINRFNRYQ